jgi:hypothetical protein
LSVNFLSSDHGPADGEKSLDLGALLEALLQGVDQAVAFVVDLVLDIKDGLALAALFAFGLADAHLNGVLRVGGGGLAGFALQAAQLGLGVLQGLLGGEDLVLGPFLQLVALFLTLTYNLWGQGRFNYISELDVTEEFEIFAGIFIERVPLPEKAKIDALHIAVAALNGMDYSLTWNCAHIANVFLRPKGEAVCRGFGYAPPTICTPQE